MPVFVFRPGHPDADENGMVDRDLAGPLQSGSAPYVISDIMDPTRHMATGKMHTSKAAFRADTKASGCIEVGNDSSLEPRGPRSFTKPPMDRRDRREAIKRTIYELRNGRR